MKSRRRDPSYAADERVHDVSQARLCGVYTKNPIGVKFEHVDDGKMATYFARWVSQRGEVGPWSLATGMRIAA